MNKKSAVFTISVIAAIIMVVFSAAGMYAFPTFELTYRGLDIPAPTNVAYIFKYHLWFIVFPIVPTYFAINTYKKKEITSIYSMVSGSLSILTLVLGFFLFSYMVLSIYGPILNA